MMVPRFDDFAFDCSHIQCNTLYFMYLPTWQNVFWIHLWQQWQKPSFLNFFHNIYKIQHFIRNLDILHYYQINCCISGPLLKKMHQSLQWSFQFFIWVRKNGSKRETRRGSFKENHTTFLQNVFHYRIYWG